MEKGDIIRLKRDGIDKLDYHYWFRVDGVVNDEWIRISNIHGIYLGNSQVWNHEVVPLEDRLKVANRLAVIILGISQ